MKSLLVLLALAAVALADNPRPSYNSYDYPDSDPVYQYGYNVAAAGGYDNPAIFAQDENRNGYETHGEYRVELPDGRTQIVTYQVNGDSGFIADVRYEGEASYAPAAVAPVTYAAYPYHHAYP